MKDPNRLSWGGSLAVGAACGVIGTAVMTAFQKLVEMPITGRGDSYAPADFAERILPVQPGSVAGRSALNYVTHFALGTGWGAAYVVASRAGLSGQAAVAATFVGMYTGDVAINTALGLYEPRSWSARDAVIDVVDKLVQAEATGAAYEALRVRA